MLDPKGVTILRTKIAVLLGAAHANGATKLVLSVSAPSTHPRTLFVYLPRSLSLSLSLALYLSRSISRSLSLALSLSLSRARAISPASPASPALALSRTHALPRLSRLFASLHLRLSQRLSLTMPSPNLFFFPSPPI